MKLLLWSVLLVVGSSSAFAGKLMVDTKASQIKWSGNKIVVKAGHNGTISLKSGFVNVNDKTGMVTDGQFVIDMNSIKNLDLPDAKKKGQLEGHLKSADFFDVTKYPTATYTFKSVVPNKKKANTFLIKGNLKMKNIEKPLAIEAVITGKGKAKAAKSKVTFDRTLWNVKYNSPKFFDIKKLKDKAIDDKIALELHIKTKA